MAIKIVATDSHIPMRLYGSNQWYHQDEPPVHRGGLNFADTEKL